VDTIANGEAFNSITDKLDVMSGNRAENKYTMLIYKIKRGIVDAVTGDGNS
jgi:hypothetical protein